MIDYQSHPQRDFIKFFILRLVSLLAADNKRSNHLLLQYNLNSYEIFPVGFSVYRQLTIGYYSSQPQLYKRLDNKFDLTSLLSYQLSFGLKSD